jgi:hypothetical protein
MTPEQFMHSLTDMVHVEHFDRDTWKQPCERDKLVSSVHLALSQISHPAWQRTE